jgi:hypothetical protein
MDLDRRTPLYYYLRSGEAKVRSGMTMEKLLKAEADPITWPAEYLRR